MFCGKREVEEVYIACKKCKYNYDGECDFYDMGSGNEIDMPCYREKELIKEAADNFLQAFVGAASEVKETGMTIDDSILYMELYKRKLFNSVSDLAKDIEAYDTAIETMRKYQKIEDIYYHQSGEALENSLRAVIEDGKID